MWDKVIMLAISATACATVVVSMQMHTWVLTTGILQKQFGLLKVEVMGCKNPAGGAVNGVASGLGTFGSAACQMATSESQDGVMSYSKYAFNTCHESTKPQCALASTVKLLDAGGWSGCSVLKERCTSIQKLTSLNWGLWWFLVIAVLVNFFGSLMAWREIKYGTGGSLISMGCIFCVLSLIVFSFTNYEEPPPLSHNTTTSYGTAFWTAFLSFLLTSLQTFIGCCIYKQVDEDSDQRKKEKERLKKKEKRQSRGLEDDNDYGSSGTTLQQWQSSSKIADQTFGTLMEALRQRGVTDVAQAFRGFDVDGNGYISLEEFKQGSAQLGFTMSPEQVQWVVSQFDPNRDGHLDYTEFSMQVQKWAQTVGQV